MAITIQYHHNSGNLLRAPLPVKTCSNFLLKEVLQKVIGKFSSFILKETVRVKIMHYNQSIDMLFPLT